MVTREKSSLKESEMQKLLSTHEDLVRIPTVGETLTGPIIEKTSNAMYIDLGQMGVGVIYGRELFDDLDTFKKSKIGDIVHATIQELDNEDGYIELSLRTATRERSWVELKHKFDEGTAFETEIIDANKGGLIVRISGITGFLPVSQLAPDHYPRVEGGDKNKIYEVLKNYVGKKFNIKVINVDEETDKLIVSEKAAVSDEISTTLNKLKKLEYVEGIISGIVDFGVFVKFDTDGQELEGLVHISELAWQRIDNPGDIVSIGQKVKAKVIGIDDGLRISLSIKQLQEDPWHSVTDKYKVGDRVKGEILKVTPFGGFIKLDKEIHGLVHISELPDEMQREPNLNLNVGDEKAFTIISLDPAEHRLGLSLRTTSKSKDTGDKRKIEIKKKSLPKSSTDAESTK